MIISWWQSIVLISHAEFWIIDTQGVLIYNANVLVSERCKLWAAPAVRQL